MNSKTEKQFETIIGVDLGDIKHAVCVTDKDGNILEEKTIPNLGEALEGLVDQYPESLIALEVGTHSPWISRLLANQGAEVVVANARKLRAIYTNDRKCDKLDARMLAKLVRVDPELLSPIEHRSEESQRDFLAIKLRDTLVRQRVNIISSVRFSLKSLGTRLKSPSTAAFAASARKQLAEQPDLLGAIQPSLEVLDSLTEQIKQLDKRIEAAIIENHPEAQHLRQVRGVGPVTSLSFGPDCDLKRFGTRIAARGGKAAKKKAVIAVAGKLAVMLLVMWRNGSDYEPLRNAAVVAQASAADNRSAASETKHKKATQEMILEATARMG